MPAMEPRGRVSAALEDRVRIERAVGTQEVFSGEQPSLASQIQRHAIARADRLGGRQPVRARMSACKVAAEGRTS